MTGRAVNIVESEVLSGVEGVSDGKKYYPATEANPDFAEMEESILDYWKREDIFRKSVANREGCEEFVFYDGPPFANGLPHYGHLLTGYVKDVVARYQTMRGRHVPRRFGWDCHGLPAEMAAEKELGISGRSAITEYGIGKFNAHCRESVMRYASEWERYVDRQARWVDFDDDYKTMERDYMESVIWAFKELYKKGLIYESYRVMPYSWAAETPLSNFEIKLDNSYREREDKAITVAFELDSAPAGAPVADGYYILAWTTTPWTLPSNLALAVHREFSYHCELRDDGRCYIHIVGGDDELAEEGDSYAVKGSELIGLTYKPLFPYFASKKGEGCFRVIDGSSFIEEGSGTGIVHLAPGFGEDDQRVCAENGIDVVCPVDGRGCFSDEIFDIVAAGADDGSGEKGYSASLSLKGLNVIAQRDGKREDEPYTESQLAKYGLANLRIISWLKAEGKLVKQEDYRHSYPHCWRTDEPIIYKAMSSWYVAVTEFKDRAVELNQEINWIPAHIKDGSMGHMLSTAPDWSISRNRFWGCPIPIWRSDNPENKELYVFGSIAELEEFFGCEVKDLHRPFIDELTKPDPINPEYSLRRVEDVFDCWFESGSMPFAQLHYPFENRELFERNFPADFITEYIGQTRGWFNTLIMLSTALFDKPPFRNCICHGVVLDEETGLKYSKRLKNYKDPMEVFEKFGSDALRWMMLSSPVMRGADIGVDPEGAFIRDVVRLHIKPIWNAYNFFTLYANSDGVKARFSTDSGNIMDRYILLKLSDMVAKVRDSLDAYETPSACQAITDFLEVLNNWYIRCNRHRFWRDGIDEDKLAAYNTLYTVLHVLVRAAAPLLPIVCEKIYLGLVAAEEGKGDGSLSVHLQDFPELVLEDMSLIRDMDRVRDICNTAHSIRNVENIRIRQPLASLTIYQDADKIAGDRDYYAELIADETNVKQVIFSDALDEIASFRLKINFPVAGKRLGKLMKLVSAAVARGDWTLCEDGSVALSGEGVEGEKLLVGEYEILLEPKDKKMKGAQALASNDALLVLDTEITSGLRAEGIARDVVRLVQQARKDAGLDVADRISLYISGNDSVNRAVEANRDYICSQVLALELSLSECDSGAGEETYRTRQKLEGDDVCIALIKQ